jgi:protein-disulfide isomerase
VLEKFPKKVKLVIKHFPLRNHKYAGFSARAALAAGRQGKFWEFSDKLFEHHATLDGNKIRSISRELGLKTNRFEKDIKDPAIQSLIMRDMSEGTSAGVRGTPSIFINGRLLTDRSLAGFENMITAELKRQ